MACRAQCEKDLKPEEFKFMVAKYRRYKEIKKNGMRKKLNNTYTKNIIKINVFFCGFEEEKTKKNILEKLTSNKKCIILATKDINLTLTPVSYSYTNGRNYVNTEK
ncbi:hypothetical protein CHS0354_041456 [Potamilus streckersoni]|uniref:Uncharacterized protein n=1 Tax=Potamilus streckersoni TaxID=2493646 RepID=A0AAE0TAX2_9BIVA|nr:hypothetical protein CHS0354_041456 [Potamilus streckersoni]